MLVLSRHVGEQIVIGGNIRITVAEIRGERVRLGIAAPAWIRVDRSEVYERRMAGTSLPTNAMWTEAHIDRAAGHDEG